jgi:hypothetical protein
MKICSSGEGPYLPDVGLLIDEGEQALCSGSPGNRLLLAILVCTGSICAQISQVSVTPLKLIALSCSLRGRGLKAI